MRQSDPYRTLAREAERVYPYLTGLLAPGVPEHRLLEAPGLRSFLATPQRMLYARCRADGLIALVRLHRLRPKSPLRRAFAALGHCDADCMALLLLLRYQAAMKQKLGLPP